MSSARENNRENMRAGVLHNGRADPIRPPSTKYLTALAKWRDRKWPQQAREEVVTVVSRLSPEPVASTGSGFLLCLTPGRCAIREQGRHDGNTNQ
jgi:hypothetical protein